MASIADMLGPALQIGATILSTGGHLARGSAMKTAGARRKSSLEFEAKHLEQEAEQARGIGMRGAQDETLKAELVNSAALARAAASGAGASDPTVISILARTAGEGAYRRDVALYQGEEQARLNLLRASMAREEGEAAETDAETAQKFSNMSALSTALTGGAQALSMYDKYWAGPKSRFDTGIGK